ncbi:hypothetical protein DNL40_15865 [Xylanimonas oleitrophica]|uniref:Fibronectin type-III domain-containing protein n=1 Tax=Xylanimonas oleitrophica TaxID=2607479 RepID=A0A2W5XQ24_9MICO|nr:hypothetical protein [Xylanimonas oleitrophica]PZR51568.1 hypothetical protein DNL40_15865 [Xylanimonas oleitrophica]
MRTGLLRRLRGAPGDRQRGVVEAGVAVTGAALVLGAALGSGVASTVVTMSDGVTWIPDDETGQVVQINPATGRAERRLQVAGPGAELDVSQRDGHLVIGDARTGTVTSIDLATLLAGGQRASEEPVEVLVGGGRVYLVTPSTGTVRAVDPLALTDLARPYRAQGPFADAVVDEQGTVWVVGTDGVLRTVSWQPSERALTVSDPRPVRGAGTGTRLLPHHEGVTVFAPDGGAVLQVGVGRDLAVAVPDLSGEVLPAASSPSDLAPAGVPGRSAVVMLAGDRILDVGVGALGCERPGRPAVFGGRVYVPCTGAGRVIVLAPDGTRGGPDVVVPGGRDPRLLVDDGRLVVLTEDGSRAVLVEADGSSRQIDTGRGGAPVQDPRNGSPGPQASAPRRAAQPPAAGAGAGQPRGPERETVQPPFAGEAPRADAERPSGVWGGPDAGTVPEGVAPPRLPDVAGAPPLGAEPGPGAGRGGGSGTPQVPGGPSASPGAPTAGPGAAVPPSTAPPGAGTPAPTVSPTSAPSSSPAPSPAPSTTAEPDAGSTPDPAPSLPDEPEPEPVPTPPAAVAPQPATGVAATARPDGSVTVSWAPSPSEVDSYLVGPEGGSTTSFGPGARSADVRGLPPGDFRFVVVAVSGSLSTASAPSNVVTVAGTPGPVGGLAASVQGRAGDVLDVAVSWAPAADHGSPVTGYAVAWSGGGAVGSTSVAGTSTALAVSCGGQPLCTAGGTLTVSVTPRNGVGEGPAASTTTAVAAPPPPGPAPGDRVVDWVSEGTPGTHDPVVPVIASLSPPPGWAAHPGRCILVFDGRDVRDIPCGTSGQVGLPGSPGGTEHSLRVDAVVDGARVPSATVTGYISPRNNWYYCDENGLCYQPVSLGPGSVGDPDVVVVPLPWTPVPGVPGGPDRPTLLAGGTGLLLAAALMRGLRTRRAATGAPDRPATKEPAA